MAKESYITQEDIDILSRYMDAVDTTTKKIATPVALIAEGGAWFIVDLAINALVPAPAKFIEKIAYRIGKLAIAWCISDWVGSRVNDGIRSISSDLKEACEDVLAKVQNAEESNVEVVDAELMDEA